MWQWELAHLLPKYQRMNPYIPHCWVWVESCAIVPAFGAHFNTLWAWKKLFMWTAGWLSLALLSTRERNFLPTSTRTQKRETCLMRTAPTKWRTTASWWTEMYVSCLFDLLCLPDQRHALCLELWIAHVFLMANSVERSLLSHLFPPYVYLLYYSLRCLLLSLSFRVAICSHVLLFSLPVCPFSFSSTVACFFQSGRYCMNSSFSTTSEISPSHVAILSHPACESWKRSAQNHFASLGCFIECVRIVYLEPIRSWRSDVFRI